MCTSYTILSLVAIDMAVEMGWSMWCGRGMGLRGDRGNNTTIFLKSSWFTSCYDPPASLQPAMYLLGIHRGCGCQKGLLTLYRVREWECHQICSLCHFATKHFCPHFDHCAMS